MIRSASTLERTSLLRNKLKSSNLKGQVIIEVFVNGEWERLDDIDARRGVSWNKSAKTFKYANFALTPMASTINFDIVNTNGRYSEGFRASIRGFN